MSALGEEVLSGKRAARLDGGVLLEVWGLRSRADCPAVYLDKGRGKLESGVAKESVRLIDDLN